MKKGMGKQKGSAFERLICTKLSLWVSGNKRDDLFWRSAMSGGRATVKFKKGQDNKSQHGDVSAIASEGEKLLEKVTVECKSYSDLKINSLIFGTPKSNSLLGFWLTHFKECRIQRKIPFLVAKQNHAPFILLLTTVDVKTQVKPLSVFTNHNCIMYNFNEFIKRIPIRKFLNYAKK